MESSATAEQSPISTLCSGTWRWDNDGKCVVRFNEDGTGELLCGVEFTMAIACQVEWQLRSEAENVAKELPAEFDIAMTFTKRPAENDRYKAQLTFLKDVAYQQKTFHLRLEKGTFPVEGRTHYGYTPVYTHKLLWDRSPYPPPEEWADQNFAKGTKVFERNDFYKGDVKPIPQIP